MNTYGGDRTATLLDADGRSDGPEASYSRQFPVFTKNNYGYNEFKINTDDFQMKGSSASYNLKLAKYSSLFLMKDGDSQVRNTMKVCK